MGNSKSKHNLFTVKYGTSDPDPYLNTISIDILTYKNVKALKKILFPFFTPDRIEKCIGALEEALMCDYGMELQNSICVNTQYNVPVVRIIQKFVPIVDDKHYTIYVTIY